MSAARKITVGRICYRTSFVSNPGYRGGLADLFSGELRAQIRRHNVPQQRVVYFDGRRSRSEEVNVDYGVRGLSFQLRSAGNDNITYCKEFRHFSFCVEHPVLLPVGGPPPDLAPDGETATIAGLSCRRAEYQGTRHLLVWYTDEVDVEDPTGAVLHLDRVPGLILQIEEIPVSPNVDAVERTTVTALSFEAPPPGIFSVPDGFLKFDGIDAVRAEDRRILDAKSAEELQHHPLGADERDMFVGQWRLDMPRDKIQVEIIRERENEYRFRTKVPAAPADVAGRVRDEKASMKGRLLLVEDPPNYRLYRSGGGGRNLILVDNELFTFTRV